MKCFKTTEITSYEELEQRIILRIIIINDAKFVINDYIIIMMN